MKKTYKIKGMHCNSCANLIENELKDKVSSISVSYTKEEAEIDFDENKISESEIKEAIERHGYEVEETSLTDKNIKKITQDLEDLKFSVKKIESLEKNIDKKEIEEIKELRHIEKEIKNLKKEASEDKEEPQSNNLSDKIGWLVLIGSIILLGIILFYFSGLKIPEISLPQINEKTSLILLFVLGIVTGLHCIAMCGGFVVSYTAKNAINGHKSFKQHLVYGGSKVFSYAIIGGVFGLIGGVFAFSTTLRGYIAIFAGIFMICYALSMFGFSFFRKLQINPKFLTKFSANASKNAKGPYKAPFITGLLNGLFIACGPLQAMYIYAAGTANFFTGVLSLGAFGLGTLPVMFGFGSLATVISHKTTKRILKFSAIIVLALGLIMLNRGLSLSGSSFSFDSVKEKLTGASAVPLSGELNIVNGVQEINMDVDASGYHPNSFVLKKGVPVKWNVNVKQLTGCNSELVVNDYKIDKNLKAGLNIIEFTPDKTGTIRFSCGMGMLRGSFIVTETGTANQQEIASATPTAGGSCSSGGSCGCGCGGKK